MSTITYYVLSALAVLITLTVHEYFHGYAAYKLGDPTAKSLGRLTLNPIHHLDPYGAICMVLFHFGWAKPVPINARYFKKPKRDFAITALAGPASNIAMALFSAFLYAVLLKLFSGMLFTSELIYSIVQNSEIFVYIFHRVNIGLALFNLIPIPPLDGSRLLCAILPTKLYFEIMKYERTIYYIFIGWLLVGGFISSFLLRIDFIAQNTLLASIARIFSLSNLLSDAIGALSDLIIKLFTSIPFLKV